jgi:hypothetical protein
MSILFLPRGGPEKCAYTLCALLGDPFILLNNSQQIFFLQNENECTFKLGVWRETGTGYSNFTITYQIYGVVILGCYGLLRDFILLEK